MTDAAIHCIQWTRSDNAVRSTAHSGSPRTFSPRDDKPRSVPYQSNSSYSLHASVIARRERSDRRGNPLKHNTRPLNHPPRTPTSIQTPQKYQLINSGSNNIGKKKKICANVLMCFQSLHFINCHLFTRIPRLSLHSLLLFHYEISTHPIAFPFTQFFT